MKVDLDPTFNISNNKLSDSSRVFPTIVKGSQCREKGRKPGQRAGNIGMVRDVKVNPGGKSVARKEERYSHKSRWGGQRFELGYRAGRPTPAANELTQSHKNT